VGAILVAAATSLPELSTDVYAVLQGNPSLAVGDLFGSSMANMLILAVGDLLTRPTRMLARVTINQALVGTLGILLTIIAALGILAGGAAVPLGLGWATLTIGVAYVAGMRLLHRNRPEPPFRTAAEVAEARRGAGELRTAFVGFGVAALVILVAARFLASSAAALAEALGVSQGFIGIVLLAVTTSLPEAAVTTASIRAGSYDLAVGNLLGSNCFNMAVLLPLDLLDGGGSLLAAVEPGLAAGALFGVLLMALALLDVLNKSERRLWAIEPGPAAMILAYAVGLWIVYRAGP
jgi:cation:H+ antiporter